MLRNVLALDLDQVEDAFQRLLAGPGEEIGGRPGEQAAALDRGRDLPDLRCDDADSGNAPESFTHLCRQIAEDIAGRILTENQDAPDLGERITQKVANSAREAEQTEHSQNRNRQAHQSQTRARRPGQEVAHGEDPEA